MAAEIDRIGIHIPDDCTEDEKHNEAGAYRVEGLDSRDRRRRSSPRRYQVQDRLRRIELHIEPIR
ncbi:hypothetical protein GCM10009000_059330 [Halobacterium noricense]|uniref:Uncharacterized protein n=1 Tax=Haladaptatus pallidirubidus TaxID=1008152 RepID=A0AAV3UGN7_9EURY